MRQPASTAGSVVTVLRARQLGPRTNRRVSARARGAARRHAQKIGGHCERGRRKDEAAERRVEEAAKVHDERGHREHEREHEPALQLGVLVEHGLHAAAPLRARR